MSLPKVRLTKTFKVSPTREYRGETIDSILKGSVFYWVDERGGVKNKEAGLVATDEEHPYLCSDKVWVPLRYLEVYDDRLDQIIELLKVDKPKGNRIGTACVDVVVNPSASLSEEEIGKITAEKFRRVDSGEDVAYNGKKKSEKVQELLNSDTVEEVLNVLTQAVKGFKNLGKNTDR